MYRVVVDFVSFFAEDLGECPLMRNRRGFCEEHNVRVCRSNEGTISVREGLLVPIFCVLRVRIAIFVIGEGGGGGCGCASASDFHVGGGVWFLGLAIAVSTVTGESCGYVLGVGPSEGDEGGPLSRSGEAGGE